MLQLSKLAGHIRSIGENDERYAEVYRKLFEALDLAEFFKLIEYIEEKE